MYSFFKGTSFSSDLVAVSSDIFFNKSEVLLPFRGHGLLGGGDTDLTNVGDDGNQEPVAVCLVFG